MIYVYRDDAGNLHDFDFALGTAPGKFEIEDVVYRRVFTIPGVSFKGDGWACKS